MGRFSGSLDNPINWSVRVGRWFGITIRLHLFFIAGALWLFFEALAPATGDAAPPVGRALLYGMGGVGILFFSVLVHEFGHCIGARYVGGTAEEILLWPLGGLATVSPPHTPVAHLITAVAGPLVNVVFCAISSFALILWVGHLGAVPWNPFSPYTPVANYITYTEGQQWLAIFYGINYVLLLFNLLLPMYPFDGGRVFQCLLWPRRGYQQATMIASGVGMVGAIALGLFGLLTEQFLLIGIALFGYLTCYQQRHLLKMGAFEADNEFGYDFSQGYVSLAKTHQKHTKPGFFAGRRQARAEKREARERQELEALQKQVDEILAKVSRDGMDSLTRAERATLKKATERQRVLENRRDSR